MVHFLYILTKLMAELSSTDHTPVFLVYTLIISYYYDTKPNKMHTETYTCTCTNIHTYIHTYIHIIINAY